MTVTTAWVKWMIPSASIMPKYKPKVSMFYIHHCQFSKLTQTCYYKNIFKGPTISRNEVELQVTAITCLQALKNKTLNVVPAVLTLQKTSRHNWPNLLTERESSLPGVTNTTCFWQFKVQTFAAQLVGDTNIIEQHVTETTCLNVVHPTLKVGICLPTDYTNQIIVWKNPHHDQEDIHSLGTYDV